MRYFLWLAIDQLCNFNLRLIFLKHRERNDNQMCDDWKKWNYSGAVSLEVKSLSIISLTSSQLKKLASCDSLIRITDFLL